MHNTTDNDASTMMTINHQGRDEGKEEGGMGVGLEKLVLCAVWNGGGGGGGGGGEEGRRVKVRWEERERREEGERRRGGKE